MPYQSFDWASGTPLDETNLNTYVRDNMDDLNTRLGAQENTTSRLIASQILSVDASSIAFDNIPQGYNRLHLRLMLRSNLAGVADNLLLRVNELTTPTSYRSFSGRLGISNIWEVGENTGTVNGIVFGIVTGASAVVNWFSNSTITINNYTGNIPKGLYCNGQLPLVSGAGSQRVVLGSGLCLDTNAITKITLLPQNGTQFVDGSRAYLIGEF